MVDLVYRIIGYYRVFIIMIKLMIRNHCSQFYIYHFNNVVCIQSIIDSMF